VANNVAPRPFRALCDAARAGDRARARWLADALTPLPAAYHERTRQIVDTLTRLAVSIQPRHSSAA
jgi:dihydrodipicolinate synthase/N-acetylneuraminate lyase